MNDINVSFEFFPPKNKESIESLWSNIRRLEPLQPKFISVTYGAGGSTRENTHNLVKEIKKKTNSPQQPTLPVLIPQFKKLRKLLMIIGITILSTLLHLEVMFRR